MKSKTPERMNVNPSKAEQILLDEGLCNCSLRQIRENIGAALKAAKTKRVASVMP